MLLIGVIVILVSLTLAFFANSLVDTGYGYRASAQAEAVATSGVEDALLWLDRNPAFATSSYQVAVGSSTAVVSVTQAAGLATILSVATVSGHTRKMSVIVSINTTTDQPSVVSWQTIQ